MNSELINALKQIEKERFIPFKLLIETMETALAAAYKKNFKTMQNLSVKINHQTGEPKLLNQKLVVNKVKDADLEISLKEAKKIKPDVKEGEEINIEITPSNFGRIAAQTAKQIIVQKLKEAERDIIFDEYNKKVGEIVTGIFQRYEYKNILLDIGKDVGKIEAIIPPQEQVSIENFRYGDRIKFYVVEIKKTSRGPQIIGSRSSIDFLKKLFELEVPEISQGLIEIKSASREPGYRSKIAVKSKDSNIDPVGACVGSRGSRVHNIVDELRREKIDIINWNSDPITFISNALSPSKVISVALKEKDKSAFVVVPDHQLSLAIGKDGQNARLAAKLTNWKIDIKSESQAKEMPPEPEPEPEKIKEELIEEEIISLENDKPAISESLEKTIEIEKIIPKNELLIDLPELQPMPVEFEEKEKKDIEKKKKQEKEELKREEKIFALKKKKKLIKPALRRRLEEDEDYEEPS
ncbi:MAG: transcription termination/antitermination protein NusA [Armatimonadetes bacterium]|nr:transcription termination/antitermination protein NusA [Armatimonadota bacterium]